jgi:hypothetical protein
MNHQQRILILVLVVGASLLAYPMVVLLTALNINQRDPLYYEKSYESLYSLSSDGEDFGSITFRSEVLSSDVSKASIDLFGVNQESQVTSDGIWINASNSNTPSDYSVFFWFFIENPVQEAVKGEIDTQSPSQIRIIDPFGIFGNINTTFTLHFERFYIENFREFANQVSNYYAVYDDATGLKIGYALYDTTCGLLWWFDVINLATQKNMRVDLQETNFPISRNRHFFTGTVLVNFAIAACLFLIIKKWKQFTKEDTILMTKLIILGDFAFLIDGFLDIWYNNNLIGLFVVHILFTGLMVAFFPKNWRVSLISLLELAMCGVMLRFHGTIDLVLTFGVCTIGAFIGLMSLIYREIELDNKPKS